MKKTLINKIPERIPSDVQRFIDAYGRDKVDESKLEIIAAAEVFG